MSATVTARLLELSSQPAHGLAFEDTFCSWAEHVEQSRVRAGALARMLDVSRPRHFGVLLDNRPEFSLLLGAASFGGFVLVGLNSTRRGAALARDIRLADCQFILTEARYLGLLDEAAVAEIPIIDVDSAQWRETLDAVHDPPQPVDTDPEDLLMLVFTSGTSGDPKAVRCTQHKVAFPGTMLAQRFGLGAADTVYVSMPMFHSNAIMAGWSVGLAAGGNIALRRRFSASEFLPDIRRFGATFANYVGKPLAYVLATDARPDDADNPLRIMYGNEGSASLVDSFARRFGVFVADAFGSSEGGIAISPDPAAPPGALGRLPDGIAVLHGETGKPCSPAEFDASGQLRNPVEAIGELVNTLGAGSFAGYYNDPDANAERMRDGMYWSGDLAYRDAEGFVWFAGRTSGWLRVDGENLAAAPIERILLRHPNVSLAAVYGIPDPDGGDRVMAALVARDKFDPSTFGDFLHEQGDLGPKQIPDYLRLCSDLPRTATFKVLARTLREQGLNCGDPVWVRNGHCYDAL